MNIKNFFNFYLKKNDKWALTPDAGEKGELFGFDPLMPVKKGNFLALTPVTSILMADKSNF